MAYFNTQLADTHIHTRTNGPFLHVDALLHPKYSYTQTRIRTRRVFFISQTATTKKYDIKRIHFWKENPMEEHQYIEI